MSSYMPDDKGAAVAFNNQSDRAGVTGQADLGLVHSYRTVGLRLVPRRDRIAAGKA